MTPPIARTLRGLRSALIATARQVPRRRLIAVAFAIVILVALAVLVPWPTAIQMRDWATAAGPWLLVAFFTAHVLLTIFPFPRTAFTLSAGLLFGPALGISLVVAASTLSAMVAFLLVRAAGWKLTALVSHPRMAEVETRLRRRGWPAVLSLRLIALVPFSVLNYISGASGVRFLPYTAATLFGMIPGTVALVMLGDAFAGSVNPLLVLASACIACLGLLGLAIEIRSHHRDQLRLPAETAQQDTEPQPVVTN
ncbi:MAG: TVP38/TMEM64 family protein [Mycobacterium sp.]